MKMTPTTRLILIALRDVTAPLSIGDLSNETCSPPSTVMKIAGAMCTEGLIVRTKVGSMTYYSLPVPATQAA